MIDNNEKRSRINETRSKWGTVFESFRLARQWWNSAWYCVDNKSQWIDEEINRLEDIIQHAQKAINELKARKSV